MNVLGPLVHTDTQSGVLVRNKARGGSALVLICAALRICSAATRLLWANVGSTLHLGY